MKTDKLTYSFLSLREKLYRSALRFLQNDEDAKDALQDTFFKLWRNESPQSDAEARNKLFKVLRNVCIDRLRRPPNIDVKDSGVENMAIRPDFSDDTEGLEKVLDVFVFRSIKLAGDAMGNFYWAALAILCIALTWTVYLAAYSAKFNGKVWEVIRIGFLLMLYHPIKMLGVLLPLLGGAALVLLAPFMVFFAPAVVYWLSSYSLEKVFLLHMWPEDIAKVTENSESEESFDDQ